MELGCCEYSTGRLDPEEIMCLVKILNGVGVRAFCTIRSDTNHVFSELVFAIKNEPIIMRRDAKDTGFTLIELLVVVAIIGVLAAVAIPFFEGYAVRARLTEVENAMADVKNAVSEFRQERETWPNCPTINEVRNSLGIGLMSVTRISTISVLNGAITVTIQNTSPLVDGKALTLTPTLGPDGSFSWAWGWSADFPYHMRPRS